MVEGLKHIERPAPKVADRQPELHRVGVQGLGSYAPERILSNDDLAKMVDTSDAWISERTGMKERHIAKDGEATSHMAIAAAHKALANAEIDGADIELIIVATASPDTYFPSTACRVQNAIGAQRAAGFDLSAACAGFVNAMLTATAMLRSGTFRNALVIGAEKLSSLVDYEDRNTCVLFGDGAGAAVLGTDQDGPRILDNLARVDGTGLDLIELPAGGSLRPASAETVANRQHYMRIEGRKVFRFAVEVIDDSVREILNRNGYTIDDLDMLVPHQANRRIIEAAQARLGLDDAQVAINIERYGNTSAASIPLVLDELARDERLKPGMLVCLVAFGAGLSWGATLLRW